MRRVRTKLDHSMVTQKKIIGNSIELVKQIGRGSYGKVFLAQMITEPRLYFVAKSISIRNASDQSLNAMTASLNKLKTLWSPYIINLYAHVRTASHLFLFFDYCDAGTLEEYIKDKKHPMSENETLIVFRQIIEGYKELYDKKIIHRDIKPQNLMLHQGKVKIGGIAFSSVIFNVDFAVYRMHNILSIYGSPQMHRGGMIVGSMTHTNKTDIWSLGIILYEMLYGKAPYTHKNYVKAVETMQPPKLEFQKPIRSKYLIDLLRRMLAFYEQDRISWQNLFQYPIFNDMSRQVPVKWNSYQQMIDTFNHYMTYNSVRGYFRISIQDINEVPLDPSIPIHQVAERFEECVRIFRRLMKDRNQAFFFCMIAWVYYRCEDQIPNYVNKHSEFEFVLINKAIKLIRKAINLYYQMPQVPDGIPKQQWLQFKQTNQYERTRQLLFQDYTLLVRISDAIYRKIQQSQAISYRVIVLIDMIQKKAENQVFMKIYVDTLTEAILELRKQKNISLPSLLLLDYMEKSFYPENTFKGQNFDFYRFYEEQERFYGLNDIFMLRDRKTQLMMQSGFFKIISVTRKNSSGLQVSGLRTSALQTSRVNHFNPGLPAQNGGVARPLSVPSQQVISQSRLQVMPVNQARQTLPPPHQQQIIQQQTIQQSQTRSKSLAPPQQFHPASIGPDGPHPPTATPILTQSSAPNIPPPHTVQTTVSQTQLPQASAPHYYMHPQSPPTPRPQTHSVPSRPLNGSRPTSQQQMKPRSPIVPNEHHHIGPQLFPLGNLHKLSLGQIQPDVIPSLQPVQVPQPRVVVPQQAPLAPPRRRRPFSPIVKENPPHPRPSPRHLSESRISNSSRHQRRLVVGGPRGFQPRDSQSIQGHGSGGAVVEQYGHPETQFLPTQSQVTVRRPPPTRPRRQQRQPNSQYFPQ